MFDVTVDLFKFLTKRKSSDLEHCTDSEGLKLLNVPCDWVLSVCDLNINSLDVPRVTWLITMFVKVVTNAGLSLVPGVT